MNDAYFKEKAACCMTEDKIERNLFDEFGVKRGLRDFNGKGVLTGLTNISKIESSKVMDGKSVPCDGKLWFRGYEINDLVNGIGDRGFEEVAYLLLMGELPDREELDAFCKELNELRRLPQNFTRDVIMKAPGQDIMNSMTKSVLTLASYDDRVSDNSVENVLRQSMSLISVFPMLAVYGYHAYNHYDLGGSMYIHRPDPNRSTAENILYMLRPDQKYTELEARVLDTALILHMEHGGGNNSTFTTRVVTSSGSDTYSVIAAALSSLKGPKHGGANIKVVRMMNDIREHVGDTADEGEIPFLPRKTSWIRKPLTGAASSTAWGMRFILFPIPEPRSLRLSWKSLPMKKAGKPTISSIPPLSDWLPRLSARSGRSTKASAPTWISTAASSTACWTSPWSSTPRCLPWPESWAGVPTASKNLSTWTRSSDRLIRAS